MVDIYSLALCKVHGIGPAVAKRLLELYPTAEELFREPPAALAVLFRGKEKTIEDIVKRPMLKRCEEELDFMVRNNIRAYFIKDEDYPHRLRQIDDAPVCLFVKGEGDLNGERMVAIVGSRNASEYGRWATAEIVARLRELRVQTVSGLAYGIDSMAHIASLNCGVPTFGVLGHGLDRVYPSQNRSLAQSMLLQGGLVSEFFSNTAAAGYNFPCRNRIIAALCDLCIVVEAGAKSGSMITPRLAREYDREVLAVPGRIGDVYSEGCNSLIAGNIAASLSDFSMIARLMNWGEAQPGKHKSANADGRTTDATAESKPRQMQIPLSEPEPKKELPQMDETEKKLFDFLRQNKKANIDDLILRCSLDFSAASIALMTLELKGCIAALPGKCYECLI